MIEQLRALENQRRAFYTCSVVIESIREFNRAVPFVPYEIRMAGGDRYIVPHPDFISISAKGNYVLLIDQNDRPHHLNSFLIERASPIVNKARRKNGKTG